ncbi:MAG: hypothetical protein O2793_13810 [Proteobacteria bacterium]|nr:hypothetical protein [Pseudomonadota bacterium]MDA1254951.1 hypothetical protein [Pseudomonadota bacterium]
MRKILVVMTSCLLVTGCQYFPKYQAPYNIPKVSVQGTDWVGGHMINSTHKRYWYTYEKAINAEGYITQIVVDPKQTTNSSYTDIPIRNKFTTLSYQVPPADNASIRKELNKQLFLEGTTYARSICMSFFQNATYTKSHREYFKTQSNVVGGMISAALGLANIESGIISGTGVAFSGLSSSVDAYNKAFLVDPNLGMVENIVFKRIDQIFEKNKAKEYQYVSEVLIALSEYDLVCSQSGMQSIVDDALTKKLDELKSQTPNSTTMNSPATGTTTSPVATTSSTTNPPVTSTTTTPPTTKP